MDEGLLIKQWCAKPLRDGLVRLIYMGIVFRSGVVDSSPNAWLGYFKGIFFDDQDCIFRHFNLYTFQRCYDLNNILWIRRTSPIVIQRAIKNFYVAGYLTKPARWFGGRARSFGISAKNCIFPSPQQVQMVMSVPVSWSIISSSEAISFSGGADTPIKSLMRFKFSLRLRLARKP